jgi:hypothetical protein
MLSCYADELKDGFIQYAPQVRKGHGLGAHDYINAFNCFERDTFYADLWCRRQ